MTLIERLIKLRLENIKPLFDISVTSNPKDPSLSMLRLRQPSWLLNKEAYLMIGSDLIAKKLILTIILYMNSSSPTFKQEAHEIFELEKKLGLVGFSKFNLIFNKL